MSDRAATVARFLWFVVAFIPRAVYCIGQDIRAVRKAMRESTDKRQQEDDPIKTPIIIDDVRPAFKPHADPKEEHRYTLPNPPDTTPPVWNQFRCYLPQTGKLDDGRKVSILGNTVYVRKGGGLKKIGTLAKDGEVRLFNIPENAHVFRADGSAKENDPCRQT